MKEPKPRYGTRKAIDKLALELNLPNEEWMQDWPYEVVEANDIEKYIAHYHLLADEDEKFILMEGIIQAITEQENSSELAKYWNETKEILRDNFNTHEYSVFYWSCFESDDPDECWEISPHMRLLWQEMHNPNASQ